MAESADARATEQASEETEEPGCGVGTLRVRTRYRTRLQHGFQEFLARPTAITAVWILLAGVAVIHDRHVVPWGAFVQRQLTVVVPPQAVSTFLSTVTPGLLTVISIIFFVALMAVQHQSAKYSPVVLDQFMRRKINQIFFGMFVGLTVYCVLTLGLVPDGEAIVSGTLALLFSAVTMVLLLIFIYSTMDQMRPSSAAWMLQNMALRAREQYDELLRRCRSRSRLREAPATNALADRIGYVVDIDVEALAGSLSRAEEVMDQVEVELWTGMGHHVVPGAMLAQVRGGTGDQREWLAEEVLDALTLGRVRDIGRDAGHAVNQLSSMAWSATAVAGDLEGARVAVEALRTVLTSSQVLTQETTATDPGDAPDDGVLPLVYRDPLAEKAIEGLVNVVAASGISGQHQSAADTLTVLSNSLPHLSDDNQKNLIKGLERVLPTVSRHLFTLELQRAFDQLRRAMQEAEEPKSARRLGQIHDQLEQQHQLSSPD